MSGEARDLLLEIGVEELPARFCRPALDQLAEKAGAALATARLAHGAIAAFGTPRRLVLLARAVAGAQQPRDVLVKGPPARAAYDAAGAPTRAALGFAGAQGVQVGELLVQPDEKGAAYVYARRHEQGQRAELVLPALLHDLVGSLEFAQSMRWGAQQFRFARPLRWLLCLFGEQCLHFEIAGVQSGGETRGLRALGATPAIAVGMAGEYHAVCATGGIMVDPAERRAAIWRQAQDVAESLGGRVDNRDDLLEELTWLVEEPRAFAGHFDPAFLALPDAVLVTAMRTHQRYLPVYGAGDGRLLPCFIAVRNGGDAHLETVRHGNEKVLRARLSDARFFWDEDRRRRLEDRLEQLRAVVFQEQLGSQYLRTERIAWLAECIAQALGYDAATRALVARTALLCKCDLATQMVAEFPELQGVMGGAYARAQGEDPLVAAGIAEHYLPRSADAPLPQSATAIAVGLADRLNTLAGFFGLGLLPSGSADPFALRRCAQGVVAIVAERGLRLSLGGLLDAALSGYARFDEARRARTRSDALGFLRARLDGLMRERGWRYDVVDAVLAAGYDDIVDALARAEALQSSLARPEFAAVTTAFKRIATIAARAGEDQEDGIDDIVEQDAGAGALAAAEAALWQAFVSVRAQAEQALAARDYRQFYHLATTLKEPIDAFFEQVLVMDPDGEVRRRRLVLLRAIAALLTRPADLQRLAAG